MWDQYGNWISWVPDLKDGKGAMYKDIARQMENDIKAQLLRPGTKLPPQRVLANYLEVNLSTITRAYHICKNKGLISGTTGKGTYVSLDAGIPKSVLSPRHECDVIDLGTISPLEEVNGWLANEFKKIYETIDYQQILKHSSPEGLWRHRYIASKWLEERNLNALPEQIVVTSGVQNAISVILSALFDNGDKILVDEITYTGLKNVANMFGIQLLPVKMDEGGIDTEHLKLVSQQKRVKGIYLISDNHNPTTISIPGEKRKEIAAIIRKHDFILIEDGSFSYSIENPIPPISSEVPENSFYIAGTSKSIHPAFRISYVLSPARFSGRLVTTLNHLTWMASPINAEVISNLIQTGTFKDIVAKKKEIMRERNRLIDETFGQTIIPSEHASLFRFLSLPRHISGHHIETQCLAQGVQVFSGERFHVAGDPFHNGIRIASSGAADLEELRKGLLIIKKVLTSNANEKC